MVTNILFGVRTSPQRKVCAALAWIVVLLGIGIGGLSGWLMGVPVALIGLTAVAVLSRQTAAHHEKTQTREQLTKATAEHDAEALRHMVEHVPHDPNPQLASVTADFDAREIDLAVSQVRG